eukprot:3055560-Amphidinium_carterae.1
MRVWFSGPESRSWQARVLPTLDQAQAQAARKIIMRKVHALPAQLEDKRIPSTVKQICMQQSTQQQKYYNGRRPFRLTN